MQLPAAATRCQDNPTLSLPSPPSSPPLAPPQNKEFVCRGHDYERLEAFQQRMLNEFPHAIAMQHVNQPDQTIYQADAQCILGQRVATCSFTCMHGPWSVALAVVYSDRIYILRFFVCAVMFNHM